MATPDQVVSTVFFSDLNSTFHVVSDRQLTREEAHKVVAIYIALHPDAKTRQGFEYRLHYPSVSIPAGNDFPREAFTAMRADPPTPRERPAAGGGSSGGCAGMIALGLLGGAALGVWFGG